jgi:carboxymethylenebutenolidase
MTTGLHEELETALSRMRRCNDDNIIADVRAAVDYVKAQPFVQGDKIGIVGFCYGGRVSYLASCNVSDLSASVVFYGGGIGMALGDGQSPLEQTANISCPMLGLFGEEDANPTPEDVANMDAELTKAGKAHEFHNYGGAGHGFHCEARASYRAEAAADAWGKAMAWFDKHLK